MSKKDHSHGQMPAAAPLPHGQSQGTDTHAHHPTRSMFVLIWLILGMLTVVEIYVPQVYSAPWNHNTKMLLLVFLASGKAMLVAAYFMHLKWESAWVRWIALMPAYMGLFAILLMVEEHFRSAMS